LLSDDVHEFVSDNPAHIGLWGCFVSRFVTTPDEEPACEAFLEKVVEVLLLQACPPLLELLDKLFGNCQL
jgi:hypothetical protein